MIEDYRAGAWNPTNNPNYETTDDTLETLNIELCAQITRAAAASLIDLADE